MYTLQQVLQYLAQVAGAGVSNQNVVAFTLVMHHEGPLLLYANNENVDIAVKANVGDVRVTIGNWSSDDLPPPISHEARKERAGAAELSSQSKARLKEILRGSAELSKTAALARDALTAGRTMKVAQPNDFKSLDGYGFFHCEMLLLDFIVGNKIALPEDGKLELGVSKRLCAFCATAVRIYQEANRLQFSVPGAHWLAYFRWRAPPVLTDYVKAITESLNKASKSGPVFVLKSSYSSAYIENTSQYQTRCNLNVIAQPNTVQYGGSSPYREYPSDETDTNIVWMCATSSCQLNYGKAVIPVESGGMLSRLVCPFCTREVIDARHWT